MVNECRVSKENKSAKKHTRLVICGICQSKFHSLCIGYEDKSEADFNACKDCFVCTRCYNITEVITEKICMKVSQLLSSFSVDIQSSFKSLMNCTKIEDTNIKSLNEITQSIESKTSDEIAHVNKIVTSDKCIDTQSNIEISGNTSCENKTATKTEAHAKNKSALTYYLCSVENVLTIDDVHLILADANISMSGIKITEAAGTFKNKKYLIISSDDNVKMFNFKLCFSSSNLNGTWFLRTTPPRVPNSKIQSNKGTTYKPHAHLMSQNTKKTHNNGPYKNISNTNYFHSNQPSWPKTNHYGYYKNNNNALLPTPFTNVNTTSTNNAFASQNKTKSSYSNIVKSNQNSSNVSTNQHPSNIVPFLQKIIYEIENT